MNKNVAEKQIIPLTNEKFNIEKYSFNNLTETDSKGNKTLKIVDKNDINLLLSHLVNCYDIKDMINNSGETTKLVVQLTDEALSELNNGAFLNTNKKTGVMWPDLMKMGDDGRYHIIKRLPIAEESFSYGNPVQNYATIQQSICMQQQLRDLAKEIENISKVVERIEHGQKDDRVGLLNSGRKQIIRALNCSDMEIRRKELLDGRNNISIAREQILSTLKYRIEGYEKVSSNKIVRIAKEVFHEGYLENKYKEYVEIEEYFNLYLLSTNLLCSSYMITNDIKNAESVYLDTKSELKEINYTHINSLTNIMDKSDLFFFYKDEEIETTYKALLDESKQFNSVFIEVSNKELLEATYEEEKCSE